MGHLAITYRFLLFVMCRSFDFRIKRTGGGFDVRSVAIPDVRFRVRFMYENGQEPILGVPEVNGKSCMSEEDVLSILRGGLVGEWTDFSTPGIGGIDHMTSRDFDSICRMLGIEEGYHGQQERTEGTN